MTETWDDINEQVKSDWKDDTTPFERVYEIGSARTPTERLFQYNLMGKIAPIG